VGDSDKRAEEDVLKVSLGEGVVVNEGQLVDALGVSENIALFEEVTVKVSEALAEPVGEVSAVSENCWDIVAENELIAEREKKSVDWVGEIDEVNVPELVTDGLCEACCEKVDVTLFVDTLDSVLVLVSSALPVLSTVFVGQLVGELKPLPIDLERNGEEERDGEGDTLFDWRGELEEKGLAEGSHEKDKNEGDAVDEIV